MLINFGSSQGGRDLAATVATPMSQLRGHPAPNAALLLYLRAPHLLFFPTSPPICLPAISPSILCSFCQSASFPSLFGIVVPIVSSITAFFPRCSKDFPPLSLSWLLFPPSPVSFLPSALPGGVCRTVAVGTNTAGLPRSHPEGCKTQPGRCHRCPLHLGREPAGEGWDEAERRAPTASRSQRRAENPISPLFHPESVLEGGGIEDGEGPLRARGCARSSRCWWQPLRWPHPAPAI